VRARARYRPGHVDHGPGGKRSGYSASFVGRKSGEQRAPNREYFDAGQYRSVPWERRTEAARLLAALKDPYRGRDAVLAGEGTREGNRASRAAVRSAVTGSRIAARSSALEGRYG
jgi:hypothetical protein